MTPRRARAVPAVRSRLARRVPGGRDRWSVLPGDGVVDPDPHGDMAPALHAPPALAASAAAFVAEASRGTAPPPPGSEGLLELVDVRCEVGPDPAADTVGAIRAAALRGRRGRPLRGPGGLLDLPSPQSPRRPRRTLVIDGPVAVLDLRARSAENFFHLHVDALANRWLLDRLRPDLAADPALRWLVPRGPAAWSGEVLALAGLADDVLVPLDDADRVLARRFIVPARGLGSRHVPAWTVAALRAVGGGPGADGAGPPGHGGAASGPPRLVHVSRGDATRRRLVGDDVLRARLADRGFTTVTLTGMPVAEQRQRFAAADVIVAEHGAALTNLVWARPGAHVVELLPIARPNLAYRRIARQAGVVHAGVLCAPVHDGDAARDDHGDMLADTDLVLRVVEDAMAAVGRR